MPPPSLFYLTLAVFHLFPLHSPITLWGLDAPFGRFASKSSRWNLNGNLAWFVMEVSAPIVFLTTVVSTQHGPLNNRQLILSGMYITHYLHRAILSPLILSPKRSGLHLSIPILGIAFNLVNAYALSIGVIFFPSSVSSTRFALGSLGWALGFAGNIYHDEVLNDLRREPDRRLVSRLSDEEKEDHKVGKGRYAIPRSGLFRYISFPNYLCEWAEWAAFAYIATSSPFLPVPPLLTLQRQLPILKMLGNGLWWPRKLLSPGWCFVLAEISAMLPRAVKGHRWYKTTFGDRFPRDRKVVVPGIF